MYIPPWQTMPRSVRRPAKISFRRWLRMYATAAGQRTSTFCFSCAYVDGGRQMRPKSKSGRSRRSRFEIGALRLSFASNAPCTWQARMRSSRKTGVLEASESSKPFSTMFTIVGRSGRGSSSQICDFMANAWVRSWMIDAPSP